MEQEGKEPKNCHSKYKSIHRKYTPDLADNETTHPV